VTMRAHRLVGRLPVARLRRATRDGECQPGDGEGRSGSGPEIFGLIGQSDQGDRACVVSESGPGASAVIVLQGKLPGLELTAATNQGRTPHTEPGNARLPRVLSCWRPP
jgi:hypothetical protein